MTKKSIPSAKRKHDNAFIHKGNKYETEYCKTCTLKGDEIPTQWEPSPQNRIKDSGDRTQFKDADGNEIGQRDMHFGKGRMYLLPCTAIIELSKHSENGALKYGERNVDKGIPQHSFIDSGLRHLFKYLRGDRDENHLVAALWNIAWAVEQEHTKPQLQDIPSRLEERGGEND